MFPAFVFFVVGCVIFVPVFFALNYPEILRNTKFVETKCTTIHAALRPYRHCSIGACQCRESVGNPSCADRIARNGDVDAFDVSPDTMSLLTGACGHGYRCCDSCCSMCTSCSTNSKGKRTCAVYPCACTCCRSVGDQLCDYSCNTHYQATALLSFAIAERPVTTLLVEDFQSSESSARAFLSFAELHPNVTSKCWYDPDWSVSSHISSSDLIFDRQRGYSWWKWTLSSIGIICIAVSVILCAFSLAKARRS